MSAVRRLASLGRAAREEAAIRVRQPLARMRVAVPSEVRGPEFDALIDLLAAETNVKAIEAVDSDAELVRLRGKANFRTLGKKFGNQVKTVAAAVEALDPGSLRRLEAGESVDQPFALSPEDVTVVREVVTDWPVASDGPFVVALDPALTPALKHEGLARELVSRVQRLRKDAGYEVSTRIALAISGDPQVLESAGAHARHIEHETLTRELSIGTALDGADRTETISIDGLVVELAVRRHGEGRTDSGPTQVDEQ
jgi:isoleucyl-tRNA synthetase